MRSSFNPRGRHSTKHRGRLATVHLVVFVAASFLLPSVVERAPVAAASAGQSSFEFAAYCQKLCIWGRGGNLCRCNAVHFVGKRRTPMGLHMDVRIDGSANVSTGSQYPNGRLQATEDPADSSIDKMSPGNINMGTSRRVADATFGRVARWRNKLDKVDGSFLSENYRDYDDYERQQRTSAGVERKQAVDETKMVLGIAGKDRHQRTGTAGRHGMRTTLTIGSRYRRNK